MQEIEIIRECKKYNPAAQKLIYKKYYSLFYRIIIRYVTASEEAKDILQDAFLRIFSNIHQYQSSGSFEGWMKRVVINEALGFLRKKSRHRMESISEYDDLDTSDPYSSMEEEDDPRYTEEELLNALQKLPDDLRMIFNMACIEDYSHKEIASYLSISEENSRAKLKRARQKLRATLQMHKSNAKRIHYEG